MSVKRDRPERPAPGELRTPDGRRARVLLPDGFTPVAPLHEATEQRPRPETPDDPRSSVMRAAPPYGAA